MTAAAMTVNGGVVVGENKVGSINMVNRDIGSDNIKQAVDTRKIIS